jgi:ABC-type lipoprotein export system ATPase subunit
VADVVVDVRAASRVYRSSSGCVTAVDGVTLRVNAGDAVAVVGSSGAGKTTLLNMIGGLDRATSGLVAVLGQDLGTLSERSLTRFRASHVGLVFQDPSLLPGLTALENVAAAGLRWRNRRVVVAEAAALLDAVGLEDRKDFPPQRLSGGERQRVGIARALLGHRPLLVADEPTGNLDEQSTRSLLNLFDALRLTHGVTLVVATHDPVVAARLPHRLTLGHGRATS